MQTGFIYLFFLIEWDHNIELFVRSSFYFERHDRKPALRGAPSQVLSHLTSLAEQKGSALRRAWSRNNIRLWYWSFVFLPVVNLKWFFCSSTGETLTTFRAALRNSTCLELNDKQAAAQNHSVILGARWRARDYFAVRLWWWAMRSVARRLSFTFLPKTRTQR